MVTRDELLDAWTTHHQDRADDAAINMAERWERGQRTDAWLITAWLRDETRNPVVIGAETWTDHDWRVITDETGIPTPISVRNLVIEMLAGER